MLATTDIQKLADLALIDVSDAECTAFAGEIDAILGYVSEVATFSGEAQTQEKQEHRNIMREDVVTNTAGEYTEAIAQQFPARSGDALEVPKIL